MTFNKKGFKQSNQLLKFKKFKLKYRSLEKD